ncbi:MAG: lactonase family protein [Gemmatimonadaceae bacterium]
MTDRLEPSRRDFLAASALGLIGIASRTTDLAVDGDSRSDGELLYVGAYTEGDPSEGVQLLRMDTQSGELRLVRSFNAGANPSFLAIHPNGRVLYAVNETTERNGKATGAVSAFAIASGNGELTRLNEQSSEGSAPCYVSVDRSGRALLVANYFGGNVALLPIQATGGIAPATHVAQHHGRGPNAERQEAAHAHSIVADPSNRFALAADLGIDRVLVYRLDLDSGSLHHIESSDAILRPGAGPRHLAFHPRLPLVFVANELDSTVATLRLDKESGALSLLQTQSTLPAGWSGTSYSADIHLTPSGRTLYVSNRGHNSIAVFSVADATGALSLEQTVPTEGDWPRNFSLDPTGRWLLVANQRSGSVVVFARDQKSGRLTSTGHQIAVTTPACLRFRAHVGVTT